MMHTLAKGILIAVEGIDGSGKSSLAKNIFDYLSNNHYPALLTKEPGDSGLGQHIRSIVQNKTVSICSKAEFLLFATDRAQHFDEVILPHLAQKKIVISDRMADSSLVYQGYGRGLDIPTIKHINEWAMNGRNPDITIYVKVSPDVAAQRIAARNAALTSFEKEKQDFILKLVQGFDTLYKNRNDVILIDGNQSFQQVSTQTKTALLQWITSNQI